MPKYIRSRQHIFSCSVIRTQCRYNHWYFSLNESSSLKFLTSHNVIPLLGFILKKNSTIHTSWTLCFILSNQMVNIYRAGSDYSRYTRSVKWLHMMPSWNGNNFRVTGHLCGDFPTQRPVTRGFDIFFDLRLNKKLSKQWWGWWYETPSCPLWRHRNVMPHFLRQNTHDTNCVSYVSSGLLRGTTSATCAAPISSNDTRYKYIFVFV